MKTVNVRLEDDLHKELKHYAINQGKPATEIVANLIKKELESKKEQSR